MTKNSLTRILDAIDDIEAENPDMSKDFIQACRKFWAAKYDIWFCNRDVEHVSERYPWMSSFQNYDEFEGLYSAMVHDALMDHAQRGEISKEDELALKKVNRKFDLIAPDDAAILPMVEEDAEFITAKPVLILPYGKKIAFYICEVDNYHGKERTR